MSKWLNVLVLSLFTAGSLLLGVFLWQSDADYRARGKTTTVTALVGLEQQTSSTRSGRYGQREKSVERTLATMTYADVSGRPITFQRFVSAETIARLQSNQSVSVEYIPGEWNTERFPGNEVGATPWFVAFIVFLALLVYVIRKPSVVSKGHAPQSGLSMGAAWMIRGALLVTGLGAIVGGGAGLLGGGGSAAGNAVMLIVGIALMSVFWLALRLRVA